MFILRGNLAACFSSALIAAARAANPAPALEWVKKIQAEGPGVTQVAGVASDGQGSLYIAGSASSSAFPATHVYGGASGTSAFVVKLGPAGKVVYAIRVGGSGMDTTAGVAVTGDGGVDVGGPTSSADFPVTKGAYQTTRAPGNFIFRLNASGTLAWATYFGDTMSVIGAVAAGLDGSIYVSGSTYGNLPVTASAYQTLFEPAYVCSATQVGPCFPLTNGFLTKLNSSGSALSYSTYLGFRFYASTAFAVDALSNVY